MDRDSAIAYLRRKGKIDPKVTVKLTKEEEKLVERVEREGKIFGDPMIEIKS